MFKYPSLASSAVGQSEVFVLLNVISVSEDGPCCLGGSSHGVCYLFREILLRGCLNTSNTNKLGLEDWDGMSALRSSITSQY